jgi:hypothetical protein
MEEFRAEAARREGHPRSRWCGRYRNDLDCLDLRDIRLAAVALTMLISELQPDAELHLPRR